MAGWWGWQYGGVGVRWLGLGLGLGLGLVLGLGLDKGAEAVACSPGWLTVQATP